MPRTTHRRSLVRSSRTATLAILLGLAACRGCAPRAAQAPGPGGGPPPPQRGTNALSFDATTLYRQMGLIARGLPLPALGRAAFLGTRSPDTTHVVVALTFSSSALTFAREADDRFRANYEVSIVIGRDNQVVARSDAEEEVLVNAYRETTRTDDAIIFQDVLDVAPGQYTLQVTLRDRSSRRSIEERITIDVPRFEGTSLSTPIPVVEVTARTAREALPSILLSPSGTAVLGRDSIIPLYLESYGNSGAAVRLHVRNERGRQLWSDTVTLASRGAVNSGVIAVPVSRIGIGVATLTFVHEGSGDSSSTNVFAGFGNDMPVATYEDIISFLRYYASPGRIQKLREAAEEERPQAWAAFVRETDPNNTTLEHEELRAYFAKLVRANGRFREEASPGWLTDRGKVFVTLGEPDQLVEPPGAEFQRNRQQIWEYRMLNLSLVFFDQTGTGRWRLTQTSEVRFESEFRRRLK